ncbi:hypothetical protein Tco_0637887 [Tanacetum coccineum]
MGRGLAGEVARGVEAVGAKLCDRCSGLGGCGDMSESGRLTDRLGGGTRRGFRQVGSGEWRVELRGGSRLEGSVLVPVDFGMRGGWVLGVVLREGPGSLKDVFGAVVGDFVILEMEENSKVPLILGRPYLHTADAVIRVKQKQLNLGVGT